MSNLYDRVLQENFQVFTVPLLKKITGIQSVKIVAKSRKLHRTIERETDHFLLIAPLQGPPFLGNIEMQAGNDPKMLKRMLLYHALGYDLHELPVRGFVIYLGERPLRMRNTLEHADLKFKITIIDLKELDPEMFLSSDLPEEILLAILAGTTRQEEKRKIVREVIAKLYQLLSHDPGELNRRLRQLEILGKLRKIQNIILEEEQNMIRVYWKYDLETDVRYLQGKEKGVEEGIEKGREEGIEEGLEKGMKKGIAHLRRKMARIVRNLVKHTTLSSEEIAKIAGVPLSFVAGIKKDQ